MKWYMGLLILISFFTFIGCPLALPVISVATNSLVKKITTDVEKREREAE